MYRTVGALLVISLAASACARSRAPAPEDVDGLSRYLFANWEDEENVAEAMTNLAIWLDTEGRSELAQTDGYVLTALNEEEVGDLTYPTRIPLTDTVGVAASYESPYPIEDHAALLPMQDQRWNAPKKYDRYDRVLIEGEEAAFLAADAHLTPEMIRTDNDIIQSRVGVTIPYTLRKDYRWTTIGDGRRAVIARTWAEEHGCSGDDGDGGNCLELSFSVDLFLEDTDGDTLRMTSSWNRLSLVINLSDEFQIAQLANGIIGVFEDTDAFLEEQAEGEAGTD